MHTQLQFGQYFSSQAHNTQTIEANHATKPKSASAALVQLSRQYPIGDALFVVENVYNTTSQSLLNNTLTKLGHFTMPYLNSGVNLSVLAPLTNYQPNAPQYLEPCLIYTPKQGAEELCKKWFKYALTQRFNSLLDPQYQNIKPYLQPIIQTLMNRPSTDALFTAINAKLTASEFSANGSLANIMQVETLNNARIMYLPEAAIKQFAQILHIKHTQGQDVNFITALNRLIETTNPHLKIHLVCGEELPFFEKLQSKVQKAFTTAKINSVNYQSFLNAYGNNAWEKFCTNEVNAFLAEKMKNPDYALCYVLATDAKKTELLEQAKQDYYASDKLKKACLDKILLPAYLKLFTPEVMVSKRIDSAVLQNNALQMAENLWRNCNNELPKIKALFIKNMFKLQGINSNAQNFAEAATNIATIMMFELKQQIAEFKETQAIEYPKGAHFSFGKGILKLNNDFIQRSWNVIKALTGLNDAQKQELQVGLIAQFSNIMPLPLLTRIVSDNTRESLKANAIMYTISTIPTTPA